MRTFNMGDVLDDLFRFVMIAAIIAAVTMGLTLLGRAISTDHSVRRYYMGRPGATWAGRTSSPGVVACVYADNPWESDDQVFCSSNMDDALKFMKAANEGLVKK